MYISYVKFLTLIILSISNTFVILDLLGDNKNDSIIFLLTTGTTLNTLVYFGIISLVFLIYLIDYIKHRKLISLYIFILSFIILYVKLGNVTFAWHSEAQSMSIEYYIANHPIRYTIWESLKYLYIWIGILPKGFYYLFIYSLPFFILALIGSVLFDVLKNWKESFKRL